MAFTTLFRSRMPLSLSPSLLAPKKSFSSSVAVCSRPNRGICEKNVISSTKLKIWVRNRRTLERTHTEGSVQGRGTNGLRAPLPLNPLAKTHKKKGRRGAGRARNASIRTVARYFFADHQSGCSNAGTASKGYAKSLRYDSDRRGHTLRHS